MFDLISVFVLVALLIMRLHIFSTPYLPILSYICIHAGRAAILFYVENTFHAMVKYERRRTKDGCARLTVLPTEVITLTHTITSTICTGN